MATGPRGLQGLQGPKGPRGLQGAPGWGYGTRTGPTGTIGFPLLDQTTDFTSPVTPGSSGTVFVINSATSGSVTAVMSTTNDGSHYGFFNNTGESIIFNLGSPKVFTTGGSSYTIKPYCILTIIYQSSSGKYILA